MVAKLAPKALNVRERDQPSTPRVSTELRTILMARRGRVEQNDAATRPPDHMKSQPDTFRLDFNEECEDEQEFFPAFDDACKPQHVADVDGQECEDEHEFFPAFDDACQPQHVADVNVPEQQHQTELQKVVSVVVALPEEFQRAFFGVDAKEELFESVQVPATLHAAVGIAAGCESAQCSTCSDVDADLQGSQSSQSSPLESVEPPQGPSTPRPRQPDDAPALTLEKVQRSAKVLAVAVEVLADEVHNVASRCRAHLRPQEQPYEPKSVFALEQDPEVTALELEKLEGEQIQHLALSFCFSKDKFDQIDTSHEIKQIGVAPVVLVQPSPGLQHGASAERRASQRAHFAALAAATAPEMQPPILEPPVNGVADDDCGSSESSAFSDASLDENASSDDDCDPSESQVFEPPSDANSETAVLETPSLFAEPQSSVAEPTCPGKLTSPWHDAMERAGLGLRPALQDLATDLGASLLIEVTAAAPLNLDAVFYAIMELPSEQTEQVQHLLMDLGGFAYRDWRIQECGTDDDGLQPDAAASA